MITLNAAHIIRETRQTKYYLAISSAELRFVTRHKSLSSCEKLIWIIIADECALSPDYSCTLTQGQIAEMVDKTINTVGVAISKLRALGFLKTEAVTFGPLSYFLTLPQEGLNALLAAPARKQSASTFTPPSKTVDPSPENRGAPPLKIGYPSPENWGSPPLKTMDLLINNNINNIKHNHKHNLDLDAHSEIPATPALDVLDADALICEYKTLREEKYQDLPMHKRASAALSHFSDIQRRAINQRSLELAVIADRQKMQAEHAKAAQEKQQQFNEQLAKATPVPTSRPQPANCKLVEFELDNEHFLVEEAVKNQILNQIPQLHSQKKILGDASKKPIQTLIKEIFFYVTKAISQSLDDCQLKRFFVAKKLCMKGAWERPKGLERQASIQREQQWQQVKRQENKAAKAFTQVFIENVA